MSWPRANFGRGRGQDVGSPAPRGRRGQSEYDPNGGNYRGRGYFSR